MEYDNMRVAELKVISRERGLRGYSRLRRAELIALLQNNPPPPAPEPGLQDLLGLHLPHLHLLLGLDRIDLGNLNL